MTRSRAVFLFMALLLVLGSGCAPEKPASSGDDSGVSSETESVLSPGEADVPYVPTSPRTVDRMLELANVSSDDVVYDLGSGDGRIVIAAAQQYGARGVGIEIDSALVQKARANARQAGVADLVEFRHQNLFNTDLSPATVVTLYLLPTVNLKLRPKLFEELDPGTRVVSHDFDMGKWTPDTTVTLGSDTIYLWTIPETPPDL